MSEIRSQKSRFLAAFFAICLLLPVAGFCAANFSVTVRNPQGNPLSGAQVYAWDYNNLFNKVGPVTTNSQGIATFSLTIAQTADSTSSPKPNIGFLAVPDNAAGNTNYAFGREEVLFYDLWGGSIAPPVDMQLEEGSLVSLMPKKDGAVGLVSQMEISVPGVPYQVKTIIVGGSEISVATPSYNIYWPKMTQLNVSLRGDGNYSDTYKPEYYLWKGFSFKIEDQASSSFVLDHMKETKGQIAFNLSLPSEGAMVYYDNGGSLGFNNFRTFVGSTTLYVPLGLYNFKVVPSNNYAINVFPQQLVTSALQTVDVNLGDGYAVTGAVNLGTAGNKGALANVKVLAEVKVSLGGYDSWIQVEQANPSSTDGSFSFAHKFAPGNYRLRTTYIAYTNTSSYGVVDTYSTPWGCYRHATTPEFTVAASNITQNITMPQATAFMATVKDAANNPLPMVNSVAPVMFGFMPKAGQEYGTAISSYNISYNTTTGVAFAPFIGEGNLATRLDMQDVPNNKVFQKVFAPFAIQPNVTNVSSYTIDPNNFVTATGSVFIGNASEPFGGMGTINVSPVVPGTTVSSNNVFNPYGTYGAQHQDLNGTPVYAFQLEKGASYAVNVKEQSNYNNGADEFAGLIGFVPLNTIINVPANQTEPYTLNAPVALGGNFNGQLLIDGQIVTNESVGIAVENIPDEDYSSWSWKFRRVGVASPTFQVSGLQTGRYKIGVNLDGIRTDAPVYGVQQNPLIAREIFIDAMNPPAEPVKLNLNTGLIGYAQGMVMDDNGQPVEGLKIEITQAEEVDPMMAADPYYQPMKGTPVFYCSTNAQGEIVRGGTSNQNFIPLEAGDYAMYIVGIASEPVGYKFGVEAYRPVASFKVFPNQEITPVFAQIDRKYPVSGRITENGTPLAFLNFQVLNPNGENLGWGYTDENGDYQIPDGIPGGDVQLGIVVEKDGARRFYHVWRTLQSGQANVMNIELDPSTLISLQIKTKDSAGNPLGRAGGNLFLLSEPEKGLRAKHWYLTWMESGDEGNLSLQVPPPPEAGYGYALVSQDKWMDEQINKPDGSTQIVTKNFAAPPITILDLAATAPIELVWKIPAKVTVNASNIPTGKAGKYLGALLPYETFLKGPVMDMHQYTSTTGDPYGNESSGPVYAIYDGSKFTFDNVRPGKEYVFMCYETMAYLMPEDVMWANEFSWKAIFRHISSKFMVDSDELTINETFRSLANVVITATPSASLIMEPSDVVMEYSDDPMQTAGKIGWPVINKGYEWSPGGDAYIGFPLQVPENYAYRIGFSPANSSDPEAKMFLPKSDEDVRFVASETAQMPATYTIRLKAMAKISGQFQYDSAMSEGIVAMFPQGADLSDENFQPYETNAMDGMYEMFLPQGFFMGYAIPFTGGAPGFINVSIAPETQQTTLNINVRRGVAVHGAVVTKDEAGNDVPVFDASIAVMRKASDRSDLMDGQQFIPYPVMQADNIFYCDPEGGFFFEVEDGVDYYLQAIVPAGFRPMQPLKVSVDGITSVPAEGFKLTVAEGGEIWGSVNIPAFVEAEAFGSNSVQSQFGKEGKFYADASRVDPVTQRYEFKLRGLDRNMVYDIKIIPMDPSKAVKHVSQVPVTQTPSANKIMADLGDGYRVVGQLVDENGLPLAIKDVTVNLAMTLGMQNYDAIATPTTVTNKIFRTTQSIRAQDLGTDPTEYDLGDVMLEGLWARTDSYGQFEFKNVPEFLTAFVKTDNPFTLNGIGYARGKTDNFVASFTSNRIMEVPVIIPMGGKIIGRLNDENGQPIKQGMVDAGFGDFWADTKVDSNGNFELKGLIPAPNYMLNVQEVPGRAPIMRLGIPVEAGSTTNVGAITVAKAVAVNATAENLQPIASAAFGFGIPEGLGLSAIALDGKIAITDQDLLGGNYMEFITGENELYWNSFEVPASLPMVLFTVPGANSFGMVLHKEDLDGNQTLVTWSWKPGVVVPTEEQLGTGTFTVPGALNCPTLFGSIGGVLKHATVASATMNPGDAVIALYPVVASGTEFVLSNTPFPAALTSPVEGKWFIKNVPQGTYRIKAITKKYGTQFFKKVITIGATPVVEPLLLGTSVKRMYGKVVVKNATSTAVVGAKVSLNEKLFTSTDKDGVFSFYLPVGEHIVPLVKVSKPAFETRKIQEFATVASTGVVISEDVDLGTIELSNAVGKFEATVVGNTDGKPKVGAEVALIYKEDPTSLLWTVADRKYADENGFVKFTTVPTGREVTFRARAHYHQPLIYTLSATENNGNATASLKLVEAAPKVFFTGRVEELSPASYTLKASFDFNRVVTKADLALYIDEVSRLGDCTFPDDIGGRITNMLFNNEIPKKDEVIASVTYSTFGRIGLFNVVGGALFRKEFEVDPLSANGFTGRQTDSNGNKLPVGLNVPAGYLDPTVNSFQIVVEDASGTASLGSEQGDPAEFSGPAFEFTFGNSNFAAGTASQTQGLFEVTIQYLAGQKLEPRWYDENSKTWSKVGIIADSVKWDYPSTGYVTFKVSHLTKFAVLKNVQTAASSMRSDFDGDGAVALNDVVYLLAWYQTGKSTDKTAIANRAKEILASAAGPVVNVPADITDDVNGDGKADLNDIVLTLAWYQAGKSNDATVVKSRASEILSSVTGTVTSFPGEKVNR